MSRNQWSSKLSEFQSGHRAFRWFVLIAILLVATFLRFYGLEQVPPGLTHDEAYNGLDALHLIRSGEVALFYPDNGGREPLHIYLLALAFSLLGDRVWVLRLVSAFSGILAIPLVYRLGRALGPGDRSEWHGYLAATALAVSYWHIHFSRIGFRAIHLVTLSTAAVWLFWRGRQTLSYRYMVLSGVALGASLYTYLGARILPLVFLGFAVFQVFSLHRERKTSLRSTLRHPHTLGCLVTLGVALLIFMPLGAYFLTHPTRFMLRSASLSILDFSASSPQDAVSGLGNNLLSVVRMFIDRGTPNPVLNYPARPAFGILLLVGFWLGLIAATVRWSRPRNALLLLWFGLMLLPTILSIEAPHTLRAIGALPPSCILISDGLTSFGRFWTRMKPRRASLGWLVLLLSVLLIGSFVTYRDYFLGWARLPTLAEAFETARYSIAQHALALSETSDVALPLEEYAHPVAQFVLEPTLEGLIPIDAWTKDHPTTMIHRGLAPSDSLVVLHRTPTGQTKAFVTHPLGEDVVQELLQAPGSQVVLDELARPAAEQVPDMEPAMLASEPSFEPVSVTFGDIIRLLGYTRQPRTTKPGDIVHLTLYWESLKWIREDYKVFVHLVSSTGDGIAQVDGSPVHGVYATSLWHLGDIVPDSYDFTIPADAVPGKYRFEVGLYPAGNVDPLPATGRDGPAGDRIALGVHTVSLSQQDPPDLANSLDILAGDPPMFALLGYDLAPTTVKPGQSLELVLDWQAVRAIDQDYTVFIHVLDEHGQIRAQRDSPPVEGRFPTSWWFPGERIRDEHEISIRQDMAPGIYTLSVGLYYWVTGARLPLSDSTGLKLPNDRVLLPIPIQVEDPTP